MTQHGHSTITQSQHTVTAVQLTLQVEFDVAECCQVHPAL